MITFNYSITKQKSDYRLKIKIIDPFLGETIYIVTSNNKENLKNFIKRRLHEYEQESRYD
jgi:hypothetical protein